MSVRGVSSAESYRLYRIAMVLALIQAGISLLLGGAGVVFAFLSIFLMLSFYWGANMAKTGTGTMVESVTPVGPTTGIYSREHVDASTCGFIIGITAIGMYAMVAMMDIVIAILGIPWLLSGIFGMLAGRAAEKGR
ncbi:MAG: hypothetical protein ACFE7R_04200 [Candidatus Hodarchaeota archaeon]